MPFSRAHKEERLRTQLWSILHHGNGVSGHAFNLLLILLIIASLAILPLEFLPSLKAYHGVLSTIEIFTVVLFTVEYVLRIYATPNRKKYIFSFFGLVDLLSIAPFYLSFGLLETQYLRVFQLLRIIRVLKIGEIEAAAAEDEAETMQKGIGLLSGEKVEYVVTRHPFYMIIGCIPPLVATTAGLAALLAFDGHLVAIAIASCLFLFGLIFLWRAWLDFSYDVIFVTNRRLILQNQFILGRSINQVNYSAITNVKPFFQSFVGYLLRYGSILIETMAAEPGHIELRTVRHHEKAAHVIMEKCFGGDTSAEKQNAQQESGRPGR